MVKGKNPLNTILGRLVARAKCNIKSRTLWNSSHGISLYLSFISRRNFFSGSNHGDGPCVDGIFFSSLQLSSGELGYWKIEQVIGRSKN